MPGDNCISKEKIVCFSILKSINGFLDDCDSVLLFEPTSVKMAICNL